MMKDIKTLTKKDKERNEKLANEVKDFLIKNNCFQDVTIFFNRKAMFLDWKNGYKDLIIEEKDSRMIFEYGNHSTLIIAFEGKLYEVFNLCSCEYHRRIISGLETIFEKYNLYWELGYSYSISLYDI